MYEQSVYLGRELLQNKPEDMILLEIVAISEENLGMIKESLADYEKLFPLSEKLLHHYKIATLQYALKRFGECGQNLNTLISNPASANEKITINLGQGQAQEVVLLAALWNVAGMIALETGQEEEARKCFGKSLEADPQFVLPQNNLAYIDAKKQEQK
jgi:tetratricopeptide (TPR) repeat protein